MIPSVAMFKFIKTKIISKYYTRDVPNQVSSDSNFIHLQFPALKWENKKKWKNIFWVTKRDNKSITSWMEQEGLQIGTALGD